MWKLDNLTWGKPNCIYLCSLLVSKALDFVYPEVVVVGSSLQLNFQYVAKKKKNKNVKALYHDFFIMYGPCTSWPKFCCVYDKT